MGKRSTTKPEAYLRLGMRTVPIKWGCILSLLGSLLLPFPTAHRLNPSCSHCVGLTGSSLGVHHQNMVEQFHPEDYISDCF